MLVALWSRSPDSTPTPETHTVLYKVVNGSTVYLDRKCCLVQVGSLGGFTLLSSLPNIIMPVGRANQCRAPAVDLIQLPDPYRKLRWKAC